MLRSINIRHWIRNFCASNSPPLIKCYIFGSLVTETNFNDVDLILIFNKWEVREILRTARSDFNQKFQLKLHVQIFHCTQEQHIRQFIERAKFVQEVL